MGTSEKHCEGIGGWLILPMIGLFLTPVQAIFVFMTKHLPLFSTGAWETLTAESSRLYHPLWAPLLYLEIISNALFVVAAVVLLVLLFRKAFWFPFLTILFILANLVVVIVETYLIHSIPGETQKDALLQGYIAIAISGLSTLIWVPYFLFSKRIRNTYFRN